jgi:hypothetical protein
MVRKRRAIRDQRGVGIDEVYSVATGLMNRSYVCDPVHRTCCARITRIRRPSDEADLPSLNELLTFPHRHWRPCPRFLIATVPGRPVDSFCCPPVDHVVRSVKIKLIALSADTSDASDPLTTISFQPSA